MAAVAFFGHDAHDAAFRRRAESLIAAGARLTSFTMRRGPVRALGWRNVDLGETRDAAFAQRLGALAAGMWPTLQRADALREAEVIWARNLDMASLALTARALAGSSARFVYEALDVHRLLLRDDGVGASLRAAESRILRAADLLVTSSPAFVAGYFRPSHTRLPPVFLLENRIPASPALPPRPDPQAPPRTGPIRIGWFGALRCCNSLDLLLALADAFPQRLEISLRGTIARTELPDFERRIEIRPNVTFAGPYRYPQDLAAIYDDVDLAYAGEFFDPSGNSRWLLPNRIYESGYFGVPPIAFAPSETARWVKARGYGFVLDPPHAPTLAALIDGLDREEIHRRRRAVLAAPKSLFRAPADEPRPILAALLESGREFPHRRESPRPTPRA